MSAFSVCRTPPPIAEVPDLRRLWSPVPTRVSTHEDTEGRDTRVPTDLNTATVGVSKVRNETANGQIFAADEELVQREKNNKGVKPDAATPQVITVEDVQAYMAAIAAENRNRLQQIEARLLRVQQMYAVANLNPQMNDAAHAAQNADGLAPPTVPHTMLRPPATDKFDKAQLTPTGNLPKIGTGDNSTGALPA